MIICDNDSMRDCAPRLIFVSAATGAREVEAVTLILFLMARLVLICPMVFLNYDIYLLLISCGVIGLIHYLRFVKSPSLIFFFQMSSTASSYFFTLGTFLYYPFVIV